MCVRGGALPRTRRRARTRPRARRTGTASTAPAARQIRAYSSTKPGTTTSSSLSVAQPKKSFRLRSSANGCSASAHGGTRLSESPPSSSRFANAPVRVARRQRSGRDLADARRALGVPADIPPPAKTRPGRRAGSSSPVHSVVRPWPVLVSGEWMPRFVLYGLLSFEKRVSRWMRKSEPPLGSRIGAEVRADLLQPRRERLDERERRLQQVSARSAPCSRRTTRGRCSRADRRGTRTARGRTRLACVLASAIAGLLGLTYSYMGIQSSHGTSSDDGRRVQRGGRAQAAADPGCPRRRGAARERPRRAARAGSAAGVQAPASASGSGGGRRARETEGSGSTG